MAIGCLGVERRVERFFSYLAILRMGPDESAHHALTREEFNTLFCV
jgi:hypothetical protein